jgi:hypothetical protein
MTDKSQLPNVDEALADWFETLAKADKQLPEELDWSSGPSIDTVFEYAKALRTAIDAAMSGGKGQ